MRSRGSGLAERPSTISSRPSCGFSSKLSPTVTSKRREVEVGWSALQYAMASADTAIARHAWDESLDIQIFLGVWAWKEYGMPRHYTLLSAHLVSKFGELRRA